MLADSHLANELEYSIVQPQKLEIFLFLTSAGTLVSRQSSRLEDDKVDQINWETFNQLKALTWTQTNEDAFVILCLWIESSTTFQNKLETDYRSQLIRISFPV